MGGGEFKPQVFRHFDSFQKYLEHAEDDISILHVLLLLQGVQEVQQLA